MAENGAEFAKFNQRHILEVDSLDLVFDTVSVKFGQKFFQIRQFSNLWPENIRFVLIFNEVLNRVQSLIDFWDIHQRWEEPALELAFAERGLAIVNIVEKGPFNLPLGIFNNLQVLESLGIEHEILQVSLIMSCFWSV